MQSDQLDPNIQERLLSSFRTEKLTVDPANRALAGLCLRCYVSYPILRACKILASQFHAGNQFTYRDLLPFVLNDDGRTQIILDSEGENQLILNGNGKTQKGHFEFFTVEVLRTYRLNSDNRLNLDNWARLQTRQNPELIKFLSEFGFRPSSDWALLNRVGLKQLEHIPQRDRDIIEAFHAVYRRDRRQQPRKGMGKCPEPTDAQLQEMSLRLQDKDVEIDAPTELMQALKKVAKELRQYDKWNLEPLVIRDPDTGNYVEREFPDPNSTNELEEIEQSEILELLRRGLTAALEQSIKQGLREQIANLQKRPKYAPLASQVIPGLRLLYCQGKSLGEIATLLGMSNRIKAGRVLEPSKLLGKVRLQTVDRLFHLLEENLDLAKLSTDADYLDNLMQQLEAFVDAEVFQEAAAEINSAKNRQMNSAYAKQLCQYLEKNKE